MSNADEIRSDIERTRAELSDNVNALSASANPGNIARGQVDKVKDQATQLKERIFGAPEDPWDDGAVGDARHAVGGAVGDAKDAVGGVVADAKQAVNDAPRQLERQTRGNPLAAGLIALGVGALIGGLLPASRAEKDAARKIEDRAQPLVDEAKAMAAEARDHLQPAATEAMEQVKQVAGQAADQVKVDAVDAKDQVAGQAQMATEHVKSDASYAAEETKGEIRDVR